MMKHFRSGNAFLRTSAFGLSLAFVVLMAACTSSSPPPSDSLTLEQMVRLPAEKGRAGIIELGNHLRDLYGAPHGQPLVPETNGHLEKIRLTDGNSISEAYVAGKDDVGKDIIAFLVDPATCVDIETSTGWIGATLMGNTEEGPLYALLNPSTRVVLLYGDGKCLSMVSMAAQ